MIPATIQFKNLQTFVPAENFNKARELYKRIGFIERGSIPEMAFFVVGNFEFILQNYYNKTWAENFMMLLEVNNVDEWYNYLQSLDLPREFPGTRLMPPVDEDWARVCRMIDPSGVLWHFGQRER